MIPKISAIICSLGENPNLISAIKSLVSQKGIDNYEIIVVLNGSRYFPVSHKIGDRFGPVVKVIEIKKSGLSNARNMGVELSTAPYVAFLDDDAIASENWLTSLMKGFEAQSYNGCVGGPVLPIWCGKRPRWLDKRFYRALSLLDWGPESRELKWPERTIGTNQSWNKECIQAIGMFNLELGRSGRGLFGHEDTVVQELAAEKGYRIWYQSDALVWHRVTPDRMRIKYFIRRSYGAGRSEANVSLIEKRRKIGLAVEALQLTRSIAGFLVALFQEYNGSKKLSALLRIFGRTGLIHQAIRHKFRFGRHE